MKELDRVGAHEMSRQLLRQNEYEFHRMQLKREHPTTTASAKKETNNIVNHKRMSANRSPLPSAAHKAVAADTPEILVDNTDTQTLVSTDEQKATNNT
ncbi:jg1405 [Pararge aegeria aegeria]|uniref:Jg1405 protein n=1 Tax=Pararge aegeria aegeria TaxID=348720 RepID=A0A8S4RI86_9NEOP|nr:jg1405 [Pararge aegeria aegeria]